MKHTILLLLTILAGSQHQDEPASLHFNNVPELGCRGVPGNFQGFQVTPYTEIHCIPWSLRGSVLDLGGFEAPCFSLQYWDFFSVYPNILTPQADNNKKKRKHDLICCVCHCLYTYMTLSATVCMSLSTLTDYCSEISHPLLVYTVLSRKKVLLYAAFNWV